MANICKNLEKLAELEGITFWFHDEYLNDADKMEANNVTVYYEPCKFFSYKLPKNKLVDFEWVTNKLNKSLNRENIGSKLRKALSGSSFDWNDTFNMYPTSYGIGLVALFRFDREKAIAQRDQIANWLTSKGIEYTNEFSDAKWVYRFRMSQSQSNIEKINNL